MLGGNGKERDLGKAGNAGSSDQAAMIRDLIQRRKSMDEEYHQWEPHFRELRDYIQPTRGRFYLGEQRSNSTINKKLVDNTARRSLRTLKSGLLAGMSSPSRAWFRLGLYDDDVMDDPEVKEWLHKVQTRMYTIHRGSNLYRTLDTAYSDVGLYGTFGGLIRGDFEDVIHTHAFPMGTYRIAEDDEQIPNVIHRDVLRTVGQLVKQFGYENCSTETRRMFDQNMLSHNVHVCHAIEMRYDRDPMGKGAMNMPMASYYWEKQDPNSFLQIGGFEVNGILAPRWENIEGEVWSVSSPGMEALGDARQLQMQHVDKGMAIQLSYKPPMQAPAGFTKQFRNVPGGITTLPTTDLQQGGLRPTHEVRPDVQALLYDIQETQDRIRSAFFEDLFLMTAMSDRRQVTATEIAERHEEKLLALGPVLESLDHGLLQPIIQNTFHYMQEAEIVPPAPEQIQGSPLKVEYISLLSQAQRAVGVAAIERTIGFAGSLAQIKPEALDWIDEEKAIREFADQVGPPPSIINTPEEVAQKREQRAQQQQMQMAVENAQPLANAAKLISETSERGVEGLANGVPV